MSKTSPFVPSRATSNSSFRSSQSSFSSPIMKTPFLSPWPAKTRMRTSPVDNLDDALATSMRYLARRPVGLSLWQTSSKGGGLKTILSQQGSPRRKFPPSRIDVPHNHVLSSSRAPSRCRIATHSVAIHLSLSTATDVVPKSPQTWIAGDLELVPER